MGIQVESSLEPPRSSFAQQYGPWHYHDVRSSRYGWGEGAALISNALSERLSEGSKSKAHPALVIDEVEEQPAVSTTRSEPLSEPVQLPPTASSWPFTILIPTADPIISFPLASIPLVQPSSRPSLKRPRPSTDVDGHNTSPLPCKKRRLRLHLVTSRLSRPFSLPATHILNRESILKGNKRLRSIAAAANRRMAMAGWGIGMGGNGNAAWLRKMAVMNRFRTRMLRENLARAQAAQQAAHAQAAGQGAVTGGQGQAGAHEGGNMGGVPMQRFGTIPRPPSGPVTGFPPPVMHPNAATSAERPSVSTPHRLSPSPRLRPLRSPDLRPVEDDLDDEDVAFPTSAHESRYEGEDEEDHEVYADFGVLFGGGEEDLDEESIGMSGEIPIEQQELGLDDLDGIPWGARC